MDFKEVIFGFLVVLVCAGLVALIGGVVWGVLVTVDISTWSNPWKLVAAGFVVILMGSVAASFFEG